MSGTVVAGALGNCVHVAGVVGFLSAAEQLGCKTVFLGAAVPVDEFVEAIRQHEPDIVGVSYRLTPEVALNLVSELMSKLDAEGLGDRRFVFGGTPPVCEAVGKLGRFEKCFTGLENPDEAWAFLKGQRESGGPQEHGDTLLARLDAKSPCPLLRHHLGLPSLEETIEAAREIALAGVLDVISIAPDQNAQESFFRPEEMDSALDGAGGVPLRAEDDLVRLHDATRCGNFPLLRIYSGTRDLLKWAEVAVRTIHNAWAAVPLFWYSVLDRRSDRLLEDAIAENQACMGWYASRGIPVEVNEAHHWALRDAHDTISVVASYLAAYNARAMGVRNYVAQYMFNTPPGISGEADLAKILAQMEMVEGLHGPDFNSLRQVRAGLLHLSCEPCTAKGQLAASAFLALATAPHIIHVVGYCEGDHAASAGDVIESCRIVHGVMRNCRPQPPDMAGSAAVQARKAQLIADAQAVLQAVYDIAEDEQDPYTSPQTLSRAVTSGILDAPHLRGNPHAAGKLVTRLTPHGVYAVDEPKGSVIRETERIEQILRTLEAKPLRSC